MRTESLSRFIYSNWYRESPRIDNVIIREYTQCGLRWVSIADRIPDRVVRLIVPLWFLPLTEPKRHHIWVIREKRCKRLHWLWFFLFGHVTMRIKYSMVGKLFSHLPIFFPETIWHDIGVVWEDLLDGRSGTFLKYFWISLGVVYWMVRPIILGLVQRPEAHRHHIWIVREYGLEYVLGGILSFSRLRRLLFFFES